MKLVCELVLSALLWPLWVLSELLPKRRNLWLFGAWVGNSYSDNSRALFEYVFENMPEVQVVWRTQNPAVGSNLEKQGRPVVIAGSPRGIWLNLRAHTVIVSSGLVDVNRYLANARRVVQLYHGVPLKRIGDDARSGLQLSLYRLLRLIFLHIAYPYHHVMATSDIVAANFRTALPRAQDYRVTGFPRNDQLVGNTRSVPPEPMVLYTPTFRRNGDVSVYFKGLDMKALDGVLGDTGFKMMIKLHPTQQAAEGLIPEGVRNIAMVQSREDANSLLPRASILITDYSSVYIDYLLTDRPMLFYCFDIEDYEQHDRGFYYDYDEVTPGPKCRTWDEVQTGLQAIFSGRDDFTEARKRVCGIFHKYQDADASRRVVELVLGGRTASGPVRGRRHGRPNFRN